MLFVCLFIFISLSRSSTVYLADGRNWVMSTWVREHIDAIVLWALRIYMCINWILIVCWECDCAHGLRTAAFVQYYIDNNRFHSFLLGSFLTLPFRTKLQMEEQASEAFSRENRPQNSNSNRRGYGRALQGLKRLRRCTEVMSLWKSASNKQLQRHHHHHTSSSRLH